MSSLKLKAGDEVHPAGTTKRIEALESENAELADDMKDFLTLRLELSDAQATIKRMRSLISTHLAEFSNESEQALWEAIGGEVGDE